MKPRILLSGGDTRHMVIFDNDTERVYFTSYESTKQILHAFNSAEVCSIAAGYDDSGADRMRRRLDCRVADPCGQPQHDPRCGPRARVGGRQAPCLHRPSALGDGSWRNPADRILETFALAWSVDNGLQYDVFELPPIPTRSAIAPYREALASYPLVVSTIPLPGVDNVRVLGEGTEGSVISAKELASMRKAFATEIANKQSPKP